MTFAPVIFFPDVLEGVVPCSNSCELLKYFFFPLNKHKRSHFLRAFTWSDNKHILFHDHLTPQLWHTQGRAPRLHAHGASDCGSAMCYTAGFQKTAAAQSVLEGFIPQIFLLQRFWEDLHCQNSPFFRKTALSKAMFCTKAVVVPQLHWYERKRMASLPRRGAVLTKGVQLLCNKGQIKAWTEKTQTTLLWQMEH